MRLLLVLSLAFPLIGQEVVSWKPQMDHIFQNGRFWFKAANQDDTLRATVSVVHKDEWMEAWVVVDNRSDQDIDFRPSDCTMALVSPKQRNLLKIDPDRLSAWILNGRGQAFGRALDRFGAANLDNPLYGDKQRAEEARQRIREQQLGDQRDAEWVRENGFRTQTLEHGQTARGIVFFQPERACAGSCEVMLRVPMAPTVFEFPATFQSQRK